jgi:hypothetical protein
MNPRFTNYALAIATMLGVMSVVPLSPVWADTAPNNGDNATVDGATPQNGTTGNYDGFDRFKDSTGRPLPGWQYLFDSPG